MTIEDTKIRGLHQTILPISASNRAIGPTFGHPEVFGTQWFRRIVVLIFGMSLIPPIYYIYYFFNFYLDDQSLVEQLLLPLTIYVGWCSFIFLIITFVCLCLHFGKRQFMLSARPARSTL